VSTFLIAIDRSVRTARNCKDSSFSKGATEYATRVPQKVILIDGEQLAEFMIQYGVPVAALNPGFSAAGL